MQQLDVVLRGPEASDYLNFVIKDESSGTWYDLNGSNFRVPLRLALTSLAFDEDEDLPEAVAETELPEVPGELCGIWAYIKWEAAGCPQRSQQESDHEYQQSIQVSMRCYLM
jgi:alpha-glucan,water dikinase